MCPAVRHSHWPLKWYPGWVQPTVGGCNTTPEVAPSIRLWQCCDPVKYQCVLGFVLLCCYYWSDIIEILRLQYFPLLKESMSFRIKLQAAPAELNEYICWRHKQLFLDKDKWFQSSNYCTRLFVCFSSPQGRIGQFSHWWPSRICFLLFFLSVGSIFIVQALGTEPILHCLQLWKKTKNRAETTWLIYWFLWNAAYHTTSIMAVTHSFVYAWFIICDLELSHRWSEQCLSH